MKIRREEKHAAVSGQLRALPARVVAVCVGNVCRSPMAWGLLQLAFRERGLPVEVTSAGVHACVGMPPDPLALRLMAERGLDIGAHRGRQLLPRQVDDRTQLLVMSSDQIAWILGRRRALRGNVALLGAFTGGDIADPVGGTRRDFERALGEIEAGVAAWLDQGWQLPAGGPGAAAPGNDRSSR